MVIMKKTTRNHLILGLGLVAAYGVLSVVAKWKIEDPSIDDDNPYISHCRTDKENRFGEAESQVSSGKNLVIDGANTYETKLKPVLDKALSFGGLVILSPLLAAISFAVWIDDPGPVFFTQKRIGKGGHYIMIHKFRSMRMSTPHDVPTHQLSSPEQYITKVGRILRKTSLDELPQIWDIFRGRMSVIGPRPALWNQDDLVTERDKYGVNAVMPGLTGLAQIKGRDELEISDKVRIDEKYVKTLRESGIKAFSQDVKCFVGTVASVLKRDGVVEGGTGALHAESGDMQRKEKYVLESVKKGVVGFEDYGFKKNFNINKTAHKRVLITGAGSYIGESFEKYCKEHYPHIETTTIDMVDGSWRDYDFHGVDAVFHVAGIAHADVGKVNVEDQKKYYEVNTDLAIETAYKAKESDIGQFLFMSSMIIYGEAEYIDENTMPCPANFYGDSKWRGEVGIRKLGGDGFNVAVLRPPMIYGKGSKGNYQKLGQIARRIPLFPNVDNKRSMLYIENLCEFVALLILSGEGGVFFPQNREYGNTAEIVRKIAYVHNKKVRTSRILRYAVDLVNHMPVDMIQRMVKKAFGSSYYSKRLSIYCGLDYQKIDLKESIRRTETV